MRTDHNESEEEVAQEINISERQYRRIEKTESNTGIKAILSIAEHYNKVLVFIDKETSNQLCPTNKNNNDGKQ